MYAFFLVYCIPFAIYCFRKIYLITCRVFYLFPITLFFIPYHFPDSQSFLRITYNFSDNLSFQKSVVVSKL